MKTITNATLTRWLMQGKAEVVCEPTRSGYVELRMRNGTRRFYQVQG